MKLTFPRLIAAITFLAIFAMATRISVDTDTWWHLRAGQWIVAHQAVPTTDPLSYTRAGASWKYPGWIVEVLMYALFTAWGYAGLNLFTAVCVTLAFIFVYLTCSGPPLLRAFSLVLAAAASAVYWSARPQIVSFALAGAFAYILYLWRWQRVNYLWVLVPLMALWANAHGGFAIGFILLALTLAGQVISLAWRQGFWVADFQQRLARRAAPAAPVARPPAPGPEPGDVDLRGIVWLAGIGLACAVAVSLNPSGPLMLLYPFKTVSIGVLQDFIQEWQSPNFHLREAQIFLWLLFATFGAVALSRRRINLTDLLLVTGMAYLGFLAGRNVALLAIVAPPVLTRHAAAAWADFRSGARPAASAKPAPDLPERQALVLNWILLALLALAAVVKILIPLPAAINEKQLATIVPVQAVKFIESAHPAGPLFNSYNWGGYLTWALYPDYPVFVDGRTDLYDDTFLRQYLNVAAGRPGWEQTLNQYGVKLVLIETDSLLADRLRAAAGWQLAYADTQAVVFTRP